MEGTGIHAVGRPRVEAVPGAGERRPRLLRMVGPWT